MLSAAQYEALKFCLLSVRSRSTNDAYGTMTFIFTILFVVVANVLLLNVLVALFNVTITRVNKGAHESWSFHRFLLVEEYRKKSPFPPPFNAIHYSLDLTVAFIEFVTPYVVKAFGVLKPEKS
ncbi:unnamed protein product, partial [Didymodactylos carnosus]